MPDEITVTMGTYAELSNGRIRCELNANVEGLLGRRGTISIGLHGQHTIGDAHGDELQCQAHLNLCCLAISESSSVLCLRVFHVLYSILVLSHYCHHSNFRVFTLLAIFAPTGVR